VISVGNQAVLGIADFVAALARDPAVAAIALYIEGLTDIAAFAAAVAEARAAGIPIVVLKAGRSALGAALALSHTSSLAGDDALYQALFDRLGVLAGRFAAGAAGERQAAGGGRAASRRAARHLHLLRAAKL